VDTFAFFVSCLSLQKRCPPKGKQSKMSGSYCANLKSREETPKGREGKKDYARTSD